MDPLSRQEMLREVRKACIEVGLNVHGRKIRLADVLRTIQMKNPYSYMFDVTGQMWIWGHGKEPVPTAQKWDCTKDDLAKQSYEMISFVHGRVMKK